MRNSGKRRCTTTNTSCTASSTSDSGTPSTRSVRHTNRTFFAYTSSNVGVWLNGSHRDPGGALFDLELRSNGVEQGRVFEEIGRRASHRLCRDDHRRQTLLARGAGGELALVARRLAGFADL